MSETKERNETFDEYIVRLGKCRTLPTKMRRQAMKVLVERFENHKAGAQDKIRFVHMAHNPHLYGMFDWSECPLGPTFWKQIADAGF